MKAILHGRSPKTKELRFVPIHIIPRPAAVSTIFLLTACFAKFRFSRFSNQIGHRFLFIVLFSGVSSTYIRVICDIPQHHFDELATGFHS